eukprot:g16839.t1
MGLFIPTACFQVFLETTNCAVLRGHAIPPINVLREIFSHRSEGQPENSDEVDPWKLLDVTDIGTGEPLFSKFTWEDWQLLELRVQLHLLVHGYKHAMQDPERVTFHESHTEFYYEIFYRRPIGLRNFGAGKLSDLLEMVKDTLEIFPKTSVLDPQLSDDTPFENFLRLVEDARDDRKGDRGKGDWGDRGKGDRGKGRGYDREPVRHGGRPQHSTRWEHSAPPRGSREHSASGNADGRSSRAMPPPAPPRTEFAARGSAAEVVGGIRARRCGWRDQTEVVTRTETVRTSVTVGRLVRR